MINKRLKIMICLAIGVSLLLGSTVTVSAQNDVVRRFSNYERWWAASYAQSWSNNEGGNYKNGKRNPNFPDKKDNDCANFVSQCLWYSTAYKKTAEQKNKAGDAWEKPTKAFIGWNVSPTWVNADKLVNRFVDMDDAYLMSGRKAVNAKNLKNTNEIFTGDIIGYNWTGGSNINHVAFVSKGSYYSITPGQPGYNTAYYGKVDAKNVKVCAHSGERNNQHWSLYDFMTKSQKTNAKVYHYRVGHGFTYAKK